MREELIFKVVNLGEWAAAEVAGRFTGAPIDHKDGYIHLSTATQLQETVSKHFRGLDDLLVVAVEATALGDALKYEVSRGGDLFPHLYGVLPIEAVRWVKPLVLKADGGHVLPELASPA